MDNNYCSVLNCAEKPTGEYFLQLNGIPTQYFCKKHGENLRRAMVFIIMYLSLIGD